MNIKSFKNLYSGIIQVAVLTFLIYLTNFYDYNLFHSLSEIMSVIIGFGIYMVAWNSRIFNNNKYFTFLGVAFFFVSVFGLLHTFADKEMGMFINYPSSNLATQLWLVARYLEAFSFLVATFFIGKKLKVTRTIIFFTAISFTFFAFIFWRPIFPATYINGFGPTPFEEISAVIICISYLISILLLYKKRSFFNSLVLKFLICALILNIFSELMFVVYVGAYDDLNMIGHLLKIIVFGLLYLTFIESGLRKPYSILFKELKDSENNYRLSEQKFRSIFNYATVGILMTDLNGDITEVNQGFSNKIKFSKAELLSLSINNLSTERIDILNNEEFRKIINSESDYYEFENCYKKKNGEFLWGSTSVSLLRDINSNPANILWIIKDITQTKEMEKNKLEFVSLASHQLRTPLTSVRLATELLLRGVGDETDEKNKKYLNEINDSARLMSDMIRDLLNVSRVEMGTLTTKLEPMDLPKHFDQIINELKLQVKAKNLRLSKFYEPNLPIIIFDPQVLRMIFENLFTNAICYTPVGGKITVKVSKQNEKLLLAISDTGCGIPGSSKIRIFEKSFRTNIAKEINPNGNGLGLYIVKTVTDRAGGRVWFDSEEGKGTTFYVSLPINQD